MSFSKARTSILKLSNAHFSDDDKEHAICAVSRVSDSMDHVELSHIVPKDTPDDLARIALVLDI